MGMISILFALTGVIVCVVLIQILNKEKEKYGCKKCLNGRPCKDLSSSGRKCGSYPEIPEGARFLCGSPLSGTVYANPEQNPGMGWIL